MEYSAALVSLILEHGIKLKWEYGKSAKMYVELSKVGYCIMYTRQETSDSLLYNWTVNKIINSANIALNRVSGPAPQLYRMSRSTMLQNA